MYIKIKFYHQTRLDETCRMVWVAYVNFYNMRVKNMVKD